MKKYTIKNYKGNLVESLKKFSEKYKGMRIVEAVEDPDEKALKVTAESSGITAWCDIAMDDVTKQDAIDLLTKAEKDFNVKINKDKISWMEGWEGNKGFVEDVIEVQAPNMETFRKFVSEWIFAGQMQQDEIDDYIKNSLSKDTANLNHP